MKFLLIKQYDSNYHLKPGYSGPVLSPGVSPTGERRVYWGERLEGGDGFWSGS
jgi:hypothetical protein